MVPKSSPGITSGKEYGAHRVRSKFGAFGHFWKQIEILNEVFTPSKEEIIHAKKIVDQFNESNTGLVVIDGKLIEKPVLREMQRKILIAEKINKN